MTTPPPLTSPRGPARRFDVVVIGSGPAGASAAIALARGGFEVLITDRAEAGVGRSGETLPPRLRLDLERLGLWPEFQAAGHLRSSGMSSAWGREQPTDNPAI